MQKFIFIFFYCLMLSKATAQNNTFQKTYGTPDNDFGYDVAVLSDGFLIAGEVYAGINNNDAVLIRTNPSGEILWQKTYGNDGNDLFRFITPTNDGGFMLWGETGNTTSHHSEGWLLKIDDTGGIIWHQVYAESNLDITATGRPIPLQEDYVFSGRYAGFNPPQCGSTFTRIDNEGNIIWSKGGYTSFEDFSTNFSIRVVSDTSVWGCGQSGAPTATFALGQKAGGTHEIKYFDSLHLSVITDISVNQQGNSFFCGQGSTGISNTPSLLFGQFTNSAFALVSWAKSYTFPGWNQYSPVMKWDQNGDVIIAVNNESGGSALIKLTAQGEVIWTKEFGSAGYSNLYQPHLASDGGYVLAGNISTPETGQSDIFLIKTDVNGAVANCGLEERNTAANPSDFQALTNGLMYNFHSSFSLGSDVGLTASDLFEAAHLCKDLLPWYADEDGDGFGDAAQFVFAENPPAGYISTGGDCNDQDAAINPGAAEICGNFIDDNCNGIIDEDVVAPVAICTQNLVVVLDANGVYIIEPELIDAGSYDTCGLISLSVSPAELTAANIGQTVITLTVTDHSGNSNACFSTIELKETSSTFDNNTIENRVKIAPNPAKDQFWVFLSGDNDTEKAIVRVLNSQGQKIWLGTTFGQDKIRIDSRQFTPGVYTVIVSIKEQTTIRRIIKI